MADQDDDNANDPLEVISAELARLNGAVESGQKTHALAVRILAGALAIILGSGSYVATRQPKIAGTKEIGTYIRANPEIARPDKWSGADDDKAMRQLRSEIVKDHKSIFSEHIQIWEAVHVLEKRLNEGPSRAHDRLDGLERRTQLLENRK